MKTNIWNIINNPRSTYYVMVIYLLTAVIFSLIYHFLLVYFEGVPSLKYNTCTPSASYVTDYFGSFYFSITSQTTVGYGDIIPATVGARITSGAQAFFGYFYLAFSIALFTSKAIVRSETFKAFFLQHGKDNFTH